MKPGFVRDVYLRAIPSVDLELVTEQVDCCQYTIKMSVYDSIIKEFCENKEEEMSAHMWMLMSGPQLVQG